MPQSAPFSLADLASPLDPWGPPASVPSALRFSDVPYAPFSKGDKLGKAADWSTDAAKDTKDQKRTQYNRGQRDPFHAYGASVASSFNAKEIDEGSAFSVVDNNKTSSKPRTQTVLRRGGANPSNRGGSYNNNNTRGANNQRYNNQSTRGGQQGRFNQNYNRGGGYRRFGWRDYDKPQRIRDSSVKIGEDWRLIESVEFSRLSKLRLDVKNGEDIDDYGHVYYYNSKIDRSNGAKLAVLDRGIYNPTTSEDPIIQQIAKKDTAIAYGTDVIISQLMCAARSVISWDIIITKVGNKIYFDKREGVPLEYITVDENAADAPPDTNDDNVNNSSNLALEATFINQNFTVNAVDENGPKKEFAHENPFYNPEEETDPVLAKGYKYRKFALPSSDPEAEPLHIVLRTEVDAVQKNPVSGAEVEISIKALNQYSSRNGFDWKTQLNSHRGAIVAAEIKKNSNKFARWTNQALLAGVETIKLGFVARANPKLNTKHVILGVASYRPHDLAVQMNLNTNNGWGIVRSIIDIVSAQEDGKFIVVKDPNNPAIKLYEVPNGDIFVVPDDDDDEN